VFRYVIVINYEINQLLILYFAARQV